MKILFTVIMLALGANNASAQLLKKLKQKAADAITKPIEKSGETGTTVPVENNYDNNLKAIKPDNNLKVYSKFDFVPGSTVLYYDDFEKDRIGESPRGWITSSAAEVVTIDGLEGNWLKMESTSSQHISRSKKQSWGNNFTLEYDLLMVKKEYDPRISFVLLNSGGSLVTDEKILNTGKHAIKVSTIIGNGGNGSRVSLYNDLSGGGTVSDRMSEILPYNNATPVHISMCVQGKRFRMWWNEKKIFDLQAVNEGFLPNQFGFEFGSVGGSEFYISNLRLAKDVPDTRAQFEQGKLVSNLLFFTGTANLKPESLGALLDVSKVIKDAVEPVKIIGHTDADGEEAANQKLSEQRAETVKSLLVTQFDINGEKLTTEGRGETQPIAPNTSAEGKAQNRRVEFIFKASADVYKKPLSTESKAAKPSPVKKTKTTTL